jgi:hypothetical protein
MVLEYDINRSIGCLPFKEKVDRSDGKLCYKNSHIYDCEESASAIGLASRTSRRKIEERDQEDINIFFE